MGLLDDLKAKADVNGDGKITKEDLDSLGQSAGDADNGAIDKLKELADQSGDGKLSLDDVKSIDLGGMLGDAKDKLGGLFGK